MKPTSHHALKLYKNLFFLNLNTLNDRPGVSIKYMQNTFAGAKSLRYDATITDRVKPPCAKTSSCTKGFDKVGP